MCLLMSHFPSRPTYGLLPRPLPHVDRVGLPSVGAGLLEPTSYRDVIHTKWHLAMAGGLLLLSALARGILFVFLVFVPSLGGNVMTHFDFLYVPSFTHVPRLYYTRGPRVVDSSDMPSPSTIISSSVGNARPSA